MPHPEPPVDANHTAILNARYGRTPAARRRSHWLFVVCSLGLVGILLAWLVWGALLGAPAQFQAVDTKHTIVDNSAVDVSWQFTAPAGTSARCAVQALNSTFAIVGWTVVEIPASSVGTRTFTKRVRTTEQAVTGLIYRCWLT
ncbi:MAG: DUF4307 domain-containing protein [Rhodoglobus sp.]